MDTKRLWRTLTLMGFCGITTGVVQMYWRNYAIAVVQIVMSLGVLILSIIEQKNDSLKK